MIFLASPYSSTVHNVEYDRYEAALGCTAALIDKFQLPVFSPIVHCHGMALEYAMPKDAKFWRKYNFAFLRKADALYVLKIDGWDDSVGVRMEINLALTLQLPIHYVDEHGIEVL